VSACPYLGLSDDPTLMLSEPSPAHRCLAVRPAKSPNEAWQSNHCLIGEHVRCEYYSAAESDPQRRRQAKATGRARRHKTGAGSRVFVALLGALLLGLLVAVAVWGAGGQVQALALLGGMVKGAAPVLEATQPVTVAGEGSEEATVAVQVTLPAAPTTPPPPTAVPASATPTETPTPTPKRDIVPGSRVLPDEGRVLGDSEARRVTLPVADALHASVDGQMAMAVAEQRPAVSANSATSPTSTQAATPTPTMTPSPTAAQAKAASPTPSAEATLHVLSPGARDTGWWTDDPERPGEVGDSFLYVGQLANATFISAVRFDLLGVPRGAPLLDGEFTLTGLNDERFNREVPAIFRVQMIAESELASFDGTDFISVFSAPASITSLRDLPSVESQVGATNRWTLDANVLRWLEQELLNGAGSVTFRLSAVALPAGEETLFAWDSGFGRKTQGMGPALMLKAGSPPPTPPPLPTREYLVATLTPVPANVMTAVAHQATATAMAQTVGTYTPMPAFVTPTPLPTNLATLQANALAQGLPAVVSGRVTAVRRDAGGWQVDCEGSEVGTPVRTDGLGGGAGETASRFAGVVLALPAEQAQALLAGIAEAGGGTGRARPEARGQGGEARGLSLGQLGERVGGVSISPCWAVLLELRERVPVEYDGAFVGGSPLRWIARNNSKPGRRGGECWVLHAGPEWSREHLEAGGEWVAGELERAFWEATGLTDWGGTGGSVTARQAHRWRFALPEQPLADPFLWCPEWGLGVCGDWCGGPRVEGGWTSGARLGEELAGWWSGREGVVTD